MCPYFENVLHAAAQDLTGNDDDEQMPDGDLQSYLKAGSVAMGRINVIVSELLLHHMPWL